MKSLEQFISEGKSYMEGPKPESKDNPQDYTPVHDTHPETGKTQTTPFIKALKAGHRMTKHEVVDHWRDDHEHCVGFHSTLSNGKTYKHSQWWIVPEHLRLHHHAELSQKHRDKLARSFVEEHDSMKKQDKE